MATEEAAAAAEGEAAGGGEEAGAGLRSPVPQPRGLRACLQTVSGSLSSRPVGVQQHAHTSLFCCKQVAQAEAGGEAGRAAGGSGTLPQARAGGAARTTHEGPAVRGRQALQVLRPHALPVLTPGDPPR